MASAYEEFIPRLPEPAAVTTEDDVSKVRVSPYTADIEASRDYMSSTIQTNMINAAGKKPEEYARALRVGAEMGLHPDTVLPDLDRLETQQKAAAQANLAQTHPATASLLLDPRLAVMAQNDVENIKKIEDVLGYLSGYRAQSPTAWMSSESGREESGAEEPTPIRDLLRWAMPTSYRAVTSGVVQMEQARLGYRGVMGRPDPGDEARAKILKTAMEGLSGSETDSLLEKGYFGALQMVPQFVEQAKYRLMGAGLGALTGGAAGAGIGFLTAGPAGVPIGAAKGAERGAGIGQSAMGALAAFQMEGGLAYLEMGDMEDVAGGKIPEDIRRGASFMIGGMNAWLETLQFNSLAKMIPGVRQLVKKALVETVKQELTKESSRAALAALGKMYIKGVGTESLQETAQKAVQLLGEGFATRLSEYLGGPAFEHMGAEEIVKTLGTEFVQSAAAFVFLGIPGVALNIHPALTNVRKSQEHVNFFNALNDSLEGNSTRETYSPTIRRLVENFQAAAEAEGREPGGPIAVPAKAIGELYVEDEEGLKTFLQEAEIPAEQYEKALGYDGDVEIALPVFAQKVAGTEAGRRLVNDLRLFPGDSTFNESKKEIEYIAKTYSVTAADGMRAMAEDVDLKAVIEEIKPKIRIPGMSDADVDAQLAVLAGRAKVAAKAWTEAGSPLTPSEWIRSRVAEVRRVNEEGQVSDLALGQLITDEEEIKQLESGNKIKVYRAMQLIDGKLYPPMSAKIGGKLRAHTEIGQWERADENPELATEDGFFKLEKGNKKSIKARYNPYFHTSRTPLNDQFSEAYNRPNLVTVEVEIPESELTSGYKAARAKDAVGEMDWHSGPVSSKLPPGKKRKVILSRYAKVTRIIPDAEVADQIAELLRGEDIAIPHKVITPSLKDELIKRGVSVGAEQQQGAFGPELFQVDSWTPESEARVRRVNEKLKIVPEEKLNKWIKDLYNTARYIVATRPDMIYEASDLYSALKANADPHYDVSLDFSTICRKRAELQATIGAASVELWRREKRTLTPEEMLQIRAIMQEDGREVSCGPCYVDAGRAKAYADLGLMAEKYPALEEKFFTQAGWDYLLRNEPEIYKEMRSRFAALGGKGFESRTDYRHEIIDKYSTPAGQRAVKKFNRRSGLRWQSWSDFEFPHAMDAMQAAVDSSVVGLAGHTYTKVVEFVQLMARTGLMINMSLLPPLQGTGVDANGKLLFDATEGIDPEQAFALRKKYPKTVGTVLVVVSDEAMQAALDDPRIDYIIPYHRSGMSKALRMKMKIGGDWKDYQDYQREKVIDEQKNIETGFLNEGFRSGASTYSEARRKKSVEWYEHNGDLKKYFALCEARGLRPKFSGNGKPGKNGFRDWTGHPNYYKLLTDRRVYDDKGKFITPGPLKADFDMALVKKLHREYIAPNTEPYQPAIDKFFERTLYQKEIGVASGAAFRRWAGKGVPFVFDAAPHPLDDSYVQELNDNKIMLREIKKLIQAEEEYLNTRLEAEKKWWNENIEDPANPTDAEWEKSLDAGIIPPPDNDWDRVRLDHEWKLSDLHRRRLNIEADVDSMSEYLEEFHGYGYQFETGKPFVARVYHATPFGEFEGFESEKLGTNTKAASARLAHFFAGSRQTTDAYISPDAVDHRGYLALTPQQKIDLLAAIRDDLDERARENGEEYSTIEPEDWANEHPEHTRDIANELFPENPDYDTTPTAPKLYEVFVKMKNPLVHDYKGEHYKDVSYTEMVERARKGGHDGVVLMNTFDGGDQDNIFALLAGHENQVKSAQNVGTFDSSNRLLHQEKRGVVRGSVSFGQNGAVIKLFKDANLSTFLHEIGHIFINDLENLVATGKASAQVQADLKTLQDFVADQPDYNSQQEKLGRAFETYLLEGRAPTEELRSAFGRFRGWLTAIYRSLKAAAGIEINDEVRGVFDRLLQAEDDITAAENYHNAKTDLNSLLAEVASEAEQKRIEALKRKAHLDAVEKRTTELMRAYTKAIGSKAKREQVRNKIGEKLREQPIYQILQEAAEGGGIKYDPTASFGTRINRKHGPDTLGLSGALNPDLLAAKYGFNSTVEMIKALAKADPIQKAVSKRLREALKADRERTRQQFESQALAELYGVTFPGDAEFHSETALNVILAEAEIYRRKRVAASKRKTSTSRITSKALLDRVHADLAARPVKDAVNYRQASGAESRASRAAEAALVKGDMDEALKQKQLQAYYHAMVLASVRIRDEMKKAEAQVTRYVKGAGKIEYSYREQLLALANRYGLTDRTPADAENLEPFENFVNSIAADDPNGTPMFPLWILRGENPGDFRALTIEQARDLVGAIAWVAGRGSDHFQQLLTQKDISVATYADKAQRVAHGVRSKGIPLERSRLSGIRRKARQWISRVSQIQFYLMGMDGFANLNGATPGPNEMMFRWLADAGSRKNRIYYEEIWPEYDRLIKGIRATQRRIEAERGLYFSINGVPVTKAMTDAGIDSWTSERVISAALNMGNSGNAAALMKGYDLSPAQLQELVSMLTREDWALIQGVWDLINTQYAPMDAAYFKINNVHTRKVAPEPFQIMTENGEVIDVAGGYYPLIFDHKLSDKAARFQAEDILKNSEAAVTRTPAARAGFAIARTGGLLPPKLSLGVISQHLFDTVHYYTHAEVVRDVDRITQAPEWTAEFRRIHGREAYEEIRPWLKNVARPEQPITDVYDDFITRQRMMASIAVLGLNLKSASKQMLDFFHAMRDLGPIHVGRAIVSSWSSWSDTADEVHTMSPYMAQRRLNIDREMREVLMRTSPGKKSILIHGEEYTWNDVEKFAFKFIEIADAMVTIPTWRAAHSKALTELRMNEEEAVQYADNAVRVTQPGADLIDQVQLQRSQSWTRLFSMFISPALRVQNRMRYYWNAWRNGKMATSSYFGHVLYELLAPGIARWVFYMAFLGVLPGDDDDKRAPVSDVFFNFLDQVLGGFPVVNTIPAMIEYSRGTPSPAMEGLKRVYKFGEAGVKSTRSIWDDDLKADEEWIKFSIALADLMTYEMGVGYAPRLVKTFAEGFEDLAEGDTKNPLRLVIKVPKKDRKE